jgi:putative acetyltransferase
MIQKIMLPETNYRIVDYNPSLRKYFESLNREWLEKYFTVEPIDEKYFENPDQEILQKGGAIFFAEVSGDILGVCSLVVTEDGLELAKMAVTEKARGKGLGEFLVTEAIKRAKYMGATKLLLVTNSKLVPAIRLYEKLGFETTFRGQHPKYQRGDVVMEKLLK